MQKRIAQVWVATVLAAAFMFAPGSHLKPAAAHCPGGANGGYAAGGDILPELANGIAASIEWTQGAMCGGGVSHSVTVCKVDVDLDCIKAAQVGWRYFDGYNEPRAYCEWYGGQYKLIEKPTLSHTTHRYKQVFDTVDKYWDCIIDSTTLWSWSAGNAGFSSGTWLVAQGEAHAVHAQIGRMAGNYLLFFDMQYRRASTGTWPAFNVDAAQYMGANDPYGVSEPNFGQLRVWTNAH